MAAEDTTRRTRKSVDDYLAERLLRESSPAASRQGADPGAYEKERYTDYYNRIYPLLKEGKLDFPMMAERTGFKERRIREALLFRLTAGEVLQLFGKQDGFCYLCNNRLLGLNKEPFCLSCLEKITVVGQETQLAVRTGLTGKKERPDTEPDVSSNVVMTSYNPVWVSQSVDEDSEIDEKYAALMAELNHYKQTYGPIGPNAPDGAASEPPTKATQPEGTRKDAFLDVLELDDWDLSASGTIPEAEVEPPFSLDTIRQFGFQRQKPKG